MVINNYPACFAGCLREADKVVHDLNVLWCWRKHRELCLFASGLQRHWARRGKERQECAAQGREGDVEGHGACLVGANVGICKNHLSCPYSTSI